MLSLRKNSNDGFVGLDVDGGFVAAAQVSGGVVQRAVSHELDPGIVVDGEVAKPDDLAEALKELFNHQGLPRRVQLGVANQQIVVRHIELPHIADDREREAAIRFQTAETVAMPLEEAVIDHQLVGEIEDEDGKKRSRVLVVAARRSMVDQLVAAVRGAGLKAEGVDLSAFALMRTLHGADADGDETGRVYCHLGGVVNVAIGIGSRCVFTRPLSADWDGEDASVHDLAEELRLSIEYYRAQADAALVHELILSGPGAEVEGLAHRVGEVTGLPVTVAEPLGALPGAGFPAGEDPYRHTVSVGLAMGAAA
ncbi:MAG TPA: pilus assembly protein PilM [Thermoleophilaceae bacterium]|jgi:type IV pilus assembly protein PilM